jgi:glycosyltransferase involved in cell wall biosynthesis
MTHSVGIEMGISIVIPIKENSYFLPELLNSINNSSRLATNVQCEIIVEWGENDDPSTYIASFQQNENLTVLSKRTDGGVGQKRNAGLASAQYEIVLFVDANCTIHPNLLTTIVRAFDAPTIHALTVPIEFDPSRNPFETAISVMIPYWQAFSWAKGKRPLWWAPATTLALRRSTAINLNGFQSLSNGANYATDIDFGLRLMEHLGYPSVFTQPDCPSHYKREASTGIGKLLAYIWSVGTTESSIASAHQRMRYFESPSIILIGTFLIVIALLLTFTGLNFVRPMLLGGMFICAWEAVEILNAKRFKLQNHNIPFAVVVATIFEFSRSLMLLLRRHTLNSRYKLYPQQLKNSWRSSCFVAWFIVILTVIFYPLYTFLAQ